MQENYMISIVGKQQADGETGEIRLETLGSYVQKGDHWYIVYKEYDEDNPNRYQTSILKVEKNDKVTLMRGNSSTRLILEKGKRHPTIERDVVISSGAKVLGGFTVGEGAKIGAGAVVLKEVPPFATVVGVPGRVVRIGGVKPDLQQEKVDPNAEEIRALKHRVHKLEEALAKLTGGKVECRREEDEELFPAVGEDRGEKDENRKQREDEHNDHE